MRSSRATYCEIDELSVALQAIEIEILALKSELLLRKYSPDQPRVPGGNPDGGRWTGGSGPTGDGSSPALRRTDRSQFASRRISAAREQFCEDQYRRDAFHCTMVGLPSCHAQAMLRYSNCLAGRPIPPLNY
jgi:hypothetical protein